MCFKIKLKIVVGGAYFFPCFFGLNSGDGVGAAAAAEEDDEADALLVPPDWLLAETMGSGPSYWNWIRLSSASRAIWLIRL